MGNRLPKNPTLKDIASKAEVSVPTASRVLSGDPGIRVSAKVRERILGAARELKYRPNVLARGLKARRTETLALMLPVLDNPVFPEILQGAEEAALERGYSLFISRLSPAMIDCRQYLTILQEGRFDGLILATAFIEERVVQDLLDSGYPFVLVNRRDQRVTNHVAVDDAAGAALAVEHLIELGHRRIAHLTGSLAFDTAVRRFQGYRLALAEHGLPFDGTLVEESDWYSWREGQEATRRLLLRQPRPTAIFACNLLLAVCALSSARREGLKVPEDLSIIVLHDAPLAELVDPPLSVVRMPLREMGYRATKALIAALGQSRGQKEVPDWPVLLPPVGLVLRGSTARPPQN